MKASKPKGKPSGQKPSGPPADASGNGMRYPIPRASAQAFAGRDQNRPQNPGLIFDRFAPDWSRQSTLKKDGLEAVRRAAERVDEQLLREWNTRWQACARAANGEPFGLTTDWRFIAGLGRKGPLEVGFTFHRYGFPILPGSSVKGVARAWALLQIAEKVGATELKELDGILSADGDKEREKYEDWKAGQPAEVQKLADDFRTIFGTTVAAGRAVFFDAIPACKPTLELDIMNPHFPDYYQGDQPPTDWQSPVPVYFLTVAANTEFRFAVGWRGILDDEGQRLRDQAQQWLKDGLTHLGAGAKTSAGYGYFTTTPGSESSETIVLTEATKSSQEAVPPPPADPHQQVVDAFVHQLDRLAPKDVAGQITQYVQRWRQADVPDEYRLPMAQAILRKVEAAGRTKKSKDKPWFKELQAFVAEHGGSVEEQ
jgi:CRISPR-associated protein Cmr6